MVAKNDITGDAIQSRVSGKAYGENLEKIFGEKPRKDNSEYFARLAAEANARLQAFDQNVIMKPEYYDLDDPLEKLAKANKELGLTYDQDIDPDYPDGKE